MKPIRRSAALTTIIALDEVTARTMTAIYGAGWSRMTHTALEAAIASVRDAPRATFMRRTTKAVR